MKRIIYIVIRKKNFGVANIRIKFSHKLIITRYPNDMDDFILNFIVLLQECILIKMMK